MVDPFQTALIRERVAKIGALALLFVFLGGLFYLKFGTYVTNGQAVKAEVLHLGTYPAGSVAGGDLPILSVRLPDGSLRVVRATWQDVDNCAPGRWISVVQHGSALQVGQPGCAKAH